MRLELFPAAHLANPTVDLCVLCDAAIKPMQSLGWDHDLIGHVCGNCVGHVAAAEMRLALMALTRPPTDDEAMAFFVGKK
jgi:hypothetical protein